MNVFSIVLIVLTLLLMIFSIIFDLKIKIRNQSIALYWIVCLLGATLCLCFGLAGKSPIKTIFFNSNNINPIKILVIFLSCASISILLDKIGFFSYVACIILKKSKSSQTKLFFSFSIIISVLTIFTSNDILILTFTPFICYFTKNAKINPTPYIVSEFVCANIWSIFFLIGNPTNIYIGTWFEITFFEYAAKMALPTICCGVFAMLLVYFIFRKHLNQPISVNNVEVEKPCKPYLIIGLTGLISTIFLMSISNFIGLELWYIPLGCSVLTYLLVLISMLIKKDKLTIISNSIGSLPYALIPFLLSISVLVATIRECGIISNFASFISGQGVIVIGLLSLLIGNLLNNIPMTMFMTLTLAQYSASMNCIFGVVAASNICAILTPIGSLAGIMFMKILKNNGIEYNFKSFMKYGVVISIPTLMIGLLIIMI